LDWQALIAAQPAFEQIPLGLRRLAELQEIKAGQVLFRAGDQVRSVITVISGELRVIRRDHNGAEIILQRSRGGFIAEASLSSKAYHCDVVAAENGTVLAFPVRAFRTALDEHAIFRDAWMAQLASEVRKLRAQCERLSLHGAADRIIHYIESEGSAGEVVLSHSRKAWAAELGLSHEALYRALARLKAEGVLRVDGKLITIARAKQPVRSRRV